MSELHFSKLTPEQALSEVFGLPAFRPGQKEAIEKLWNGYDVLAILPTGGGKSLLYQLPAVMHSTGVALVISPLIALMNDQVNALRRFGIAAECVHSSMDELDQMRAISHAVTGKIRLLYLSPERALSPSFLKMVKKMPVRFLAIDEAHCISRWGNDFRPEYARLYRLRKSFSTEAPVIALTATATRAVILDIIDSLGMNEPEVIRGSFYRSNLQFEVGYPATEAEREQILLETLREQKAGQSGAGRTIVYCSTRKAVDHVYELLKQNGFKAERYHAGRSGASREKTQSGYVSGLYTILVATNAFGMGMDQDNVRTVIHYNTPDSLESYYQEAGRAGRDGQASRCLLLFRPVDFNTHRFLQRKGGQAGEKSALLEQIQGYVDGLECRQVTICRYFGEEIQPCGHCDICLEGSTTGAPSRGSSQGRKRYLDEKEKKKELRTRELQHQWTPEQEFLIRQFLEQHPGRYGRGLVAGVLGGSQSLEVKRKKLEKDPLFAGLRSVSRAAILAKIDEYLECGLVLSTSGKYPRIYWKGTDPASARKATRQIASQNPERKRTARPDAASPDKDLEKELTRFRDKKARQLKTKKYAVMQNAVIKRLSTIRPVTYEELSIIKGIGETRLAKFGEELLEILQRHEIDRAQS